MCACECARVCARERTQFCPLPPSYDDDDDDDEGRVRNHCGGAQTTRYLGMYVATGRPAALHSLGDTKKKKGKKKRKKKGKCPSMG